MAAIDRNRSRSPRGQDNGDIMRLIVAREQARLAKDWLNADDIRSQLTAMGVTVFDKTKTWSCIDGRKGNTPTFTELEAGYTGETGPQNPIAIGARSMQIKKLVQMREQARASKDFEQSDKIREELKLIGVEVFDKEKMWRSSDGSSGCIIGYRANAGPTDIEITALVAQREKARQAGDWGTGDMIRNELKSVGVEIYDKEKQWRSKDGRSGIVPTWSQGFNPTNMPVVQGGAPQKQTASASMPDLRNQLVQAALAAAANPVTAVQTLQLLQQTTAPQSIPLLKVAAAPPNKATTPRPAVKTQITPEVQDALNFIAQCGGQHIGDAEINWLVEIREKVRMQKDFSTADELRKVLKASLGIELFEKEKRWQSADGRQGSIPMWSNLEM